MNKSSINQEILQGKEEMKHNEQNRRRDINMERVDNKKKE